MWQFGLDNLVGGRVLIFPREDDGPYSGTLHVDDYGNYTAMAQDTFTNPPRQFRFKECDVDYVYIAAGQAHITLK